MHLLLDSFWRAAAYCLHPRVIALSLLPFVLMVVLGLGLVHWYWDQALAGMRGMLEARLWLAGLWNWMAGLGLGQVQDWLAPLLLILLASPLIVLVSLLAVALLMTPALVALVADRRFPMLERRRGGSFLLSLVWSLGSMLLALLALVISLPLWLIPPLVLVIPPLIWGWLTYRVMAFDALALHASREERRTLMARHRGWLLGIGVISGYLGAAPTLLWASGVVFAAAFFVLVPLAVWLYTLVFAFSSLWFTHFALAALQQLRAEDDPAVDAGRSDPDEPLALPHGQSSSAGPAAVSQLPPPA